MNRAKIGTRLDRIVGSIVMAIVVPMFFVSTAQAQDASAESVTPLPKNSLYLELLGNGFFYSINYDRVLNDKFSVRVGAAPYGDGDFFIPVLGNYLLGKGNSRLELGAGATFARITFGFFDSDEETATILGTASFAYRYQKPGGGIFAKGGFTPMFNSEGLLPWFGASIGYTLD